jgi:hypothetical protein
MPRPPGAAKLIADEPKGEPTGEDAAWLAGATGADAIRQALQPGSSTT